MALLAHILGIVIGFIGPLIIYLVKKDESDFVRDQAAEAPNFQITILIAMVVSVVLMLVVIGILLLPVVVVVNIVFCIMATIAASNGQRYRYPVCIRFIK